MNLDDAKIAEFKALPQLPVVQAAIKEGTVVEEPEVCGICEVPGSKRDEEGLCSVCGVKWEDDSDEDDDFLSALDLLFRISKLFYQFLITPKVVKKLSYGQEMSLRELDSNIADFLSEFDHDEKSL